MEGNDINRMMSHIIHGNDITDNKGEVPVVSSGDEVRFISSLEVVDTVDPLLVPLQSEVGSRGSQLPHLMCERETTQELK